METIKVDPEQEQEGSTRGPMSNRFWFVPKDKAGIVRLGKSLGVDFALTHSCYDPASDGAACGRCDACRLRSRGFREAGVLDPTRYAAVAAPRNP